MQLELTPCTPSTLGYIPCETSSCHLSKWTGPPLLYLCLAITHVIHFNLIIDSTTLCLFVCLFVFKLQILFLFQSTLQLFHIPYILPAPPFSTRMSLSHPPHQISKLPGASSLLRVRCIFSHWGQTRQSSAIYVLGTSSQWVYTAWLDPVSERSQGSRLIETAGPPIGSLSSPASSSFSLIQPQGSAVSVHWLDANSYIWLFQLLVGSFRGQSW